MPPRSQIINNRRVVGSGGLHLYQQSSTYKRKVPVWAGYTGKGQRVSCCMETARGEENSALWTPGFHHDHYDPEDLNHALLDSVLNDGKDVDEIWVFGFGSLVHTPGFEYADIRRGYIRGWKRVWWQGSTDHRGTVAFPGRTVTLVQDDESVTYGVAYKLAGDMEQQKETLKYLEWREKQYDHREYVTLYDTPVCNGSQPILENALCYIATNNKEKNPNYLGPAPIQDIARQVSRAVGPSGPNSEYVFKIEAALKEYGAEESDTELFELAKEVRRLLDYSM